MIKSADSLRPQFLNLEILLLLSERDSESLTLDKCVLKLSYR